MPRCANILWKKVRHGELTRDEAMRGAELIQRADIELVSTRGLMPSALPLSLDVGHPAYDCRSPALEIGQGAVFVTADAKFARLVERTGGSGLDIRVRELGSTG